MCGIAGFFSTTPLLRPIAERMQKALRPRGPDAQHIVGWNAAFERANDEAPALFNALVHTRLSIIDPRPEADQPMANDAGDVWICYNGEVYGWQNDAATIKAAGPPFHTRSDTEFILRAYEHWGIGCLQRLRGMFALALLDLRAGKLWLARDRMGLKPLVYTVDGDRFAFGSTVRSVLPFVPARARGFSADAIDAYLAHRYIPAPLTVFGAIRRLPNGHMLSFDLKTREVDVRPYWAPCPRQGQSDWLATLDDAVRIRTVADRPVGVFLSGGIDSSVIACRLAALGRTDLQAFTASFPGTPFDEADDAALTAATLGAPHRRVIIVPTIRDDFGRIVADLDEPFADPSSIPTWYLARATTEHVKVVLGGDGGDELFAGYKRIAKHLRTRWRRPFKVPLPFLPTRGDGGFAKLLAELALSWRDAYVLRFSGLSPGQRRWLGGESELSRAQWWRMPDDGDDLLAQLFEIDRLNYLPEYILRKADLCTMAHGLELRAPLLDHVFVETVLGLPPAKRYTHPPKMLLRAAMPQLAALDPFARKKRGFNPPLAAWLRGDLAERLDGVGSRLAARAAGRLDAARVDRFVAYYRNGEERLGEQVLQLLFLDASLAQLNDLACAC